MMITSGYTLVLYCDCKLCRDSASAGFRVIQTITSAIPHSRERCFAKAKIAGWHITRDGFCYAPGHEQNRDIELEKRWRTDADTREIELD